MNIIGCDIGGVVRDLQSGVVTDNAIESIINIIDSGCKKFYFISKCKPTMECNIVDWLKTINLDHIPIKFCREYDEKLFNL